MIPSLFDEMFLSPNENQKLLVSLREAITISAKKINPQHYSKTNFYYLGLENIESVTGNIIGNVKCTGKDIRSMKNIFESKDILYGKLRPYLNKVHLTFNSGICSTDILVLKPNLSGFLPEYVCTFLQSPHCLSITSRRMQGANLPRISSESLLSIPIPKPSLEKQKLFAEKSIEIQLLLDQQEKSLKNLEQLFESLLNKFFSQK